MGKATSIFSSQRVDLDSAEKERLVMERRKNRKIEEMKTDIAGMPYLLTSCTAILAIAMIFFNFSAFLLALPIFFFSVVSSAIIKKSTMTFAQKNKWMKLPLYTYAIGLALVVFTSSVN